MPTAPHPVLVLRHGESTANVEGLIASAPGPRTLVEVGLTERGREQARAASAEARRAGLGTDTVIITSDFARARQTAELFAAGLGAGAPLLDQRLRERDFGIHDGGPHTAYDGIWAVDLARGEHTDEVESVQHVADRTLAVLERADAAARCAPVVLVAHGDVLQILLALAAGMDPHDHRKQPPLGNAELRAVGNARPPLSSRS